MRFQDEIVHLFHLQRKRSEAKVLKKVPEAQRQ